MPLGAQHMEAARRQHPLAVGLTLSLSVRQRLQPDRVRLRQGSQVNPFSAQPLTGQAIGVAAQQDIDAAAGHVRGDGHGARPTGLGDDARFLFMLLGIQDVMRHALALEQIREHLGRLDGHRADQDRLALPVQLGDLVDDSSELGRLGFVDLIRVVLADNLPVRRDREHIQVVDFAELLRLGQRGAGHAGQLLVHTEVVLKRDRRQRQRLALDAHALFGLDRLVQPFGEAAPVHQPAGELIDNDDLTFFDDVIPIELIKDMGAQGIVQIGILLVVLGVVQALPCLQPHQRLDACDAIIGERDDAILFINLVVAFGGQAANHLCKLAIQVGGFLRLAGDDQRRPGFVDQDVIHLVDDRIHQVALHALGEALNHVVAQVIEPKLVVGAVGDIGLICLAPADGAQIAIAVVRGGKVWIEQEGAQIRVGRGRLDDADADTEQMIDRPHPLHAVLGQIVVGRDQVRTAAGQRVQIERQGRHQGFAFAGLHLGDAPLVQYRAADELHIVMAQPDGALGGFAHRRERARQDLVHDLGFALAQLPLQTLHFQLQLDLLVGIRLALPCLTGRGQLIAQRTHTLSDLRAEGFGFRAQGIVAHTRKFGRERVGLVHDRLQPLDFALV